MRNFAGFKRRAVVIVPTDEEFKKRIEKRTSEEGKDVPDSAVLEMKGTFDGRARHARPVASWPAGRCPFRVCSVL